MLKTIHQRGAVHQFGQVDQEYRTEIVLAGQDVNQLARMENMGMAARQLHLALAFQQDDLESVFGARIYHRRGDHNQRRAGHGCRSATAADRPAAASAG